jgi:hypothetical protein
MRDEGISLCKDDPALIGRFGRLDHCFKDACSQVRSKRRLLDQLSRGAQAVNRFRSSTGN